MKLSLSQETRWLCRIVRGVRSVFGEGNLGTRHVEWCPDCQAYFNASTELEEMLQLEANQARRQTSVGLEQRIIYAVGRSRQERPATHWRARLLPLASLLTGAALGALLFIAPIPLSQPRVPRVNERPRAVESRGEPIVAVDWNALIPPVALLQKNPLQDEMDLVYSDAKSALRFLELNFLPDGARRSE